MSEIHALSGAYAIDALDDDERALFDEHLATCAECRAEVASFRETAALMAETGLEAPPDSLRSGVLDGIKNIRPLPPETGQVAPPSAPPVAAPVAVTERGRSHWLPAFLAAAAAVVLLATGVVAWHPWQHATASLADQITHAPDAERITEQLPGQAGQLTLVRSASLGRAVMIGDHVPEPASGTTYQLWLQQPGAGMVSAGLMPDSHQPTVLAGDAATATAAAITVEPATGSSHPTSKPVVVFPLRAHSGGNGAA